jgi:hypothetical protein
MVIVISWNKVDGWSKKGIPVHRENQFKESIKTHGGIVGGIECQLKDIAHQNQSGFLIFVALGNELTQARDQVHKNRAWFIPLN